MHNKQTAELSLTLEFEFAPLSGTWLIMILVVLLVTGMQGFWAILPSSLAPEYLSLV
jgi:hypothetical protein